MDERAQFFEALFEHCEAMTETRVLPGGAQYFWPSGFYSEHPRLFDNFCRMSKAKNIYFGVATRDGEGGKKDNIVEIPAVWADLDYKDTPPAEIKENLSKFPFRCTIATFTGGGNHAFWVLKEPAGPQDIPKIEEANRRIAAALGGDTNAIDAARILRVPGTYNIKRGKLVRVVALNPFFYDLEDFLEQLPEPKVTPCTRQGEKDHYQGNEQLLVGMFTCRFLQWCFQNQAAVSEPLWYAMLSNLARVSPGGVSLCHLFSEGHPKYSHQETTAKILKALDAAGPHTCRFIKANGFSDCGACSAKTPYSKILKAARKLSFGHKS